MKIDKVTLQSSVVALFMLLFTLLDAQVVYHDIADITIDQNGGFYDVDMDQDGNPEFKITQYIDTGAASLTNAVILTTYDTQWANAIGKSDGHFNYPEQLAMNDNVDFYNFWNGIGGDHFAGYLTLTADSTPYPEHKWIGPVMNGYLGLRFVIDDDIHYGWARMDIAADNRSFTIKDFAYEATPDAAIVAGSGILSLNESLVDRLSIYQSDSEVFIKGVDNSTFQLTFLDLQGKMLARENFSGSYTLHTNNLQGVYILLLESEGAIRTEKIMLR